MWHLLCVLVFFPMPLKQLNIDIEITTHCNARCDFCPREEVPFLTHMSQEVFSKTLQRLQELPQKPRITFCGTGDASTHPNFVEFIQQAKAAGFRVTLTSNGQRVRGDRIDGLLQAGLDEMNFSIAELGEDYDRVYGQPFERVKKNILEFKEKLGDHPTKLTISFISKTTTKNDPKVKRNKKYWRELGFDDFKVMKFTNRATSDNIPLDPEYCKKFIADMKSQGLDVVYCPTPFMSFFVGPDGFYYLCCHDFSKQKTFGHVDTHSIADSYRLKDEYFRSDNSICLKCSVHPAHHVKIYPEEAPDILGVLKEVSTEINHFLKKIASGKGNAQTLPSGIPFRELTDVRGSINDKKSDP
jgi:MoaA/NifB/PqqE/SkfB family radical SAM enzyme